MNYDHEFGVVDLILKSEYETRGVDAFTLSLVKVERQVRRIFTHLIYQHPNFQRSDVDKLRRILAANRAMYFENFLQGIEEIYPKSVENIYGKGYKADLKILKGISKDRNKIFHGQVTEKSLSREKLIKSVESMKKWSETVATSFNHEIGYDGFARNSFRKSKKAIVLKNEDDFSSLKKYEQLLKRIDR